MTIQHHTHLLRKLRKKGWSEEELQYAHTVMSQSNKEKSSHHKFWDTWLIWVLFVIFVVGMIATMVIITPLLLLFPNPGLYAVLFALGICFGLLFEIILRDIDHLFRGHHHYFTYILVPYLAIMGGFIVFTIAKERFPNLYFVEQSPLVFSIVFVISFLIPLLVAKIIKK